MCTMGEKLHLCNYQHVFLSLISDVRGDRTVHNMLVDDKFFCITFTFEWTF